MGVSFKPDQMSKGGGLFEEGPGVIRNPRFMKFAYPKKGGTGLGQNPMGQASTAPQTVFAFDLEHLGIDEATNQPVLKTEQCIYSCGQGMEPSKDGQTIAPDGVGGFLISPLQKKLVETSNWGEMARKLWTVAADVMTALEFNDDVSVLEGQAFHFKREKQPKRNIAAKGVINANPALAAAQAAQAAQQEDRQGTFVMPQYPMLPNELPWANGVPAGAPAAAQAAPKAVAAAPKAPAAPKVAQAATKPANGHAAAAAPASAAPAAAAQVILRTIERAGGVMELKDMPQAVFATINEELKDLTPERTNILKVCRDTAFLASIGAQVDQGIVTGPA